MRRAYFKVDYDSGTKRCADCEEVKPLGEFPVRSTGYVYAYCKRCNTRRAVEWSARNRERKTANERERVARNPERETEKRRNSHYKRRYGISYAEVRSLLEKQSFMCAICKGKVCEDRLVVDHCHGSGDVRGILCNLCNISLAPIERAGFLDAALAYIERHRSGS